MELINFKAIGMTQSSIGADVAGGLIIQTDRRAQWTPDHFRTRIGHLGPCAEFTFVSEPVIKKCREDIRSNPGRADHPRPDLKRNQENSIILKGHRRNTTSLRRHKLSCRTPFVVHQDGGVALAACLKWEMKDQAYETSQSRVQGTGCLTA